MISGKNIVDFHSHILPEVDHGSNSVETSLFQLESAKRYGISKIIATPHFYPHQHNVDDFIKRRDSAYLRIKPMLADVKVKLGAEVLLYPGLENMAELEKLFLYNTQVLLLELPFTPISDDHYESVDALIKRGITVIIAHPDRYSIDTVERMISLGAKLQLNASSLIGFRKNKKVYLGWIKDGNVVAIGSDIHGRDRLAYKKLSKCFKILKKDADVVIKESNYLWNKASTYKRKPTR